jgi:hypothetical protein
MCLPAFLAAWVSSLFSTRRLYSREAKTEIQRDWSAKNFAAKKLVRFLPFICSREQIRLVENGPYACAEESELDKYFQLITFWHVHIKLDASIDAGTMFGFSAIKNIILFKLCYFELDYIYSRPKLFRPEININKYQRALATAWTRPNVQNNFWSEKTVRERLKLTIIKL